MKDLQHLSSMSRPEIPGIFPQLSGMSSPLSERWHSWSRNLSNHPDRTFVSYVLKGLQHGFRVGFDYTCPLQVAQRNMPSALVNEPVVDEYTQKELALG